MKQSRKNSLNNVVTSTLSSNNKVLSKKIKITKCSKLDELFSDTPDNTLFKLGQGTYGLTFRGCYNNVCSIKQGIKLSSVSKRYVDNTNHPTNLEIKVGKHLSRLVAAKYTPNINMILESSRCELKHLKQIKGIKKSEWLDENEDLLRQNKIYPFINVYFMEIGTIDLKKFIKERCLSNTIQFQEILEILLQVFHTLSVIQHEIKEYRHNDLKPNNLIVRINGNNMKRNFNQYNLVNKYTNGGKTFYVPHRGYTVKIIDFDFSNSKQYKNAKLRNYKTSNFRYLGYSPQINPVFDLHFLLNFFYASKEIMVAIPKFKKFIKKVLPKNCIGAQNKYVEQNKLTAYYADENKETNYIPPTLMTPTEILHYSKHFDHFLEMPTDKKIKDEFNSPFTSITQEMLKKRNDMFNVKLIR